VFKPHYNIIIIIIISFHVIDNSGPLNYKSNIVLSEYPYSEKPQQPYSMH
jgi:hypothetical protein